MGLVVWTKPANGEGFLWLRWLGRDKISSIRVDGM